MRQGGLVPVQHQDLGDASAGSLLDEVPPPQVDLSRVVVVVTVHNAPEVVRPCLRALHARTPQCVGVLLVDDAGGPYTAALLAEEADRMRAGGRSVEVLTNPTNLRYTKTINLGMRRAFATGASWAVALNSDVRVTEGWLAWMIAAGEDPATKTHVQAGRRTHRGAGIVCPLSDRAANLTLDMPPGGNYADQARRLAALVRGAWVPAVTVVGFCMAVRRECWEDVGPFDEEFSPEGYGEECDLQGRAWQRGWLGVLALSAYCRHDHHASYAGRAAGLERAAVARFLQKWANGPYSADPLQNRAWYGPACTEYRALDPLPRLAQAARRTRIRPARKAAAFYLHGVQMCGGVLALQQVCNGLVERGWDATIAVKHDRWGEWRMFRPSFQLAQMERVQDWPRSGAPTEGVVLATSWATGKLVQDVAAQNPGLVAGAFVQDREDWFRTSQGALQHAHDDVGPYLALCRARCVVNSNWVAKTMRDQLGVPAASMTWIPIGVDPDMFRPSEQPRPVDANRNPVPLRVLAFCRHSTPRRGYDLLAKVYKRLERAAPKIVRATYDEEPKPGLATLHLGKIPQAELARQMRDFDVLLELSSTQGWGMAAHEAMASGLYVVSLENGGIRNYADEAGCTIVPQASRTLDELAEVVVAEVLRLQADPAGRAARAAVARERARALSWDAVADAWDATLTGWIDGAH